MTNSAMTREQAREAAKRNAKKFTETWCQTAGDPMEMGTPMLRQYSLFDGYVECVCTDRDVDRMADLAVTYLIESDRLCRGQGITRQSMMHLVQDVAPEQKDPEAQTAPSTRDRPTIIISNRHRGTGTSVPRDLGMNFFPSRAD